MATNLTDFKVFSGYIQQAAIETLAQAVDKFNAASGGAIQLTTQGFDGDYLMQSMFQSLASAQRRVDRYSNNAPQNATNLKQIQDNSVKVAGGFGPVVWEPSEMTWIRENPAAAVDYASQTMADAILADQLNSAIAAGVAAVSNNTATTKDVSGGSVVDYNALNAGDALFGDRSNSLITRVMTGAMFHRLIGLNLDNGATLFRANNVQVVNILGKRVVVTDADALIDNTSGSETDTVLTLASGGLIVHNGSDIVTNVETSNGNDRIETTFQADYTFGLGVKGYAWDTSNGGKSPDDAAIATGSNWDKYVTSGKDTAGVVTIGDQS